MEFDDRVLWASIALGTLLLLGAVIWFLLHRRKVLKERRWMHERYRVPAGSEFCRGLVEGLRGLFRDHKQYIGDRYASTKFEEDLAFLTPDRTRGNLEDLADSIRRDIDAAAREGRIRERWRRLIPIVSALPPERFIDHFLWCHVGQCSAPLFFSRPALHQLEGWVFYLEEQNNTALEAHTEEVPDDLANILAEIDRWEQEQYEQLPADTEPTLFETEREHIRNEAQRRRAEKGAKP